MKIEKINDDQIRCVLTREDLAQRHIKLSELAYGTDKAHALFQEMLNRAEHECGFMAENNPLLVEAIPLSSDAIMIIVTKSEYPDELDARFSQFTDEPDNDYDNDFTDILPENFSSGSEDLADILNAAKAAGTSPANANGDEAVAETQKAPLTKHFSFNDLESVIKLAHLVGANYKDSNALYKNTANGRYYLVVTNTRQPLPVFAYFCTLFTEFGSQDRFSVAEDYIKEHYQTIFSSDALEALSKI